jgi:hypothetical protein
VSCVNDPVVEFRGALESILSSATFERAERLKKFLRFVCERVLNGRGEEINEYLIGIEVFDRHADYSPSEDSIVRRQAHALRKKLEEYYRNEGRESRVRIELPLGHYAAVFRVLVDSSEVDRARLPVPPPVSLAAPMWSRTHVGAFAAGCVFLFLLEWAAGHLPRTSGTTVFASDMSASMRWLWHDWLNDSSGATICLTTPRTMVIKYYPEPHPESRTEQPISDASPRARSLRDFFSLPPGGELTEYPSVGQAKMGEAVAAIRLTSLLASHHVPVRVEHTSFLAWNQARNENLIVFGHSESTPWVDRLTAGYPLRTEASSGTLPRRITVSRPKAGERSMYTVDENHPDDLYVLVSMVPGIDGEHRLLAISGLSGMASQFGAEYLTTPSHVEALASALRAAGAKPDRTTYFQVILRVSVRNNTIPLKGSIEMVRTIERPRDSSTISIAKRDSQQVP